MSSGAELTELPLARLAPLIQTRELSPVELAHAYLEQIENLNPSVNAYITVTADRALEDAQRATEELVRGVHRGPLHGIPVAYKDVFATAGVRTTAGSKVLARWVPEHDAAVVRRLREAGAVMLGKLLTDEFAVRATGANPFYGATRNPWSDAHITGGSSAGSAAAVAANLAVATLGTDTLGSIRVPAAFCGVVGLKPTFGRVSTEGVVPMFPDFDHVGPITRSVEDAALMLSAMVEGGGGDLLSALKPGLDGVRIGVPQRYFFQELGPEVERLVRRGVETLSQLGGSVREVATPEAEPMVRAERLLSRAKFQRFHAEALKNRPGELSEEMRRTLALPLPTEDEARACEVALREGRAAFDRLFGQIDLLVTPSSPIPAPPRGAELLRHAGREVRMGELVTRFAGVFSAAHLPALSVPCGYTADGLPVGIQLVAARANDAAVLRAGYAFEQATAAERKRPPLLQ